MKDIETTDDIRKLVDTFYTSVRADELLGPIFEDIVGDRWDTHLPKMYSFWGMSLFGEGGYRGNAVSKHIAIDKQHPLEAQHYDRWITLWKQTLDSLFEGKTAEEARKRAELMLQLIRIKVDAGRTGKSLF